MFSEEADSRREVAAPAGAWKTPWLEVVLGRKARGSRVKSWLPAIKSLRGGVGGAEEGEGVGEFGESRILGEVAAVDGDVNGYVWDGVLCGFAAVGVREDEELGLDPGVHFG